MGYLPRDSNQIYHDNVRQNVSVTETRLLANYHRYPYAEGESL